MQSSIFAKAVPLLEELKFNLNYEKLSNALRFYKSKDVIYPTALQRNVNISIKEAYEILEVFEENGYVKSFLQVYCPKCQKFSGHFYEVLEDIEEDLYCMHCDEEIDNPIAHAVIVYKVN